MSLSSAASPECPESPLGSERGTFDATGRDDQLLAEQDVLGDELPTGAAQVGNEPGE
jgi:hypothetical protein